VGLDNYIKKYRESRPGEIQHNKFIIYAPRPANQPASVWTGSTKISAGGIFGQTNVDHWVRNSNLAQQYKDYWDILSNDPGGLYEDTTSHKRKKNKDFEESVIAIQADLSNSLYSIR
jgi:hypothetical protein